MLDPLKLFEKLIRAKVKLEAAIQPHGDRCMIEMDPDYMGPCTCGADKVNGPLRAALKELEKD